MKLKSARSTKHILVLDPGCLTPAYNTELCLALARQKHQVTLVSAPYRRDSDYRYPTEFRVEELFFRRIGLEAHPKLRRLVKGLNYFSCYRRLLRYIQEQDVDVLHLQWLLLPPVDYWVLRWLRACRPALATIVTMHDVQPLFKVAGSAYVSKVLSVVDGVVVHGESAKQQLLATMPELDPAKVAVIEHGPLHHGEQAAQLPSREQARAKLRLPQEHHVGLFFGEIKTYKGLDVLIQALAGLNKADRHRLTFVVAGKMEEVACEPQLRRFGQLPINQRLDAQYIATSEVATYFRAADFVVLPYKSITQSGVLFTALSNERLVVISEVGELATVVRKTGGGWTVPANDPLALRRVLRELIRTDVQVLHAQGAQARAAMEQHYDWEQIAAKTLGFYQSCLNQTEELSGFHANQGCH